MNVLINLPDDVLSYLFTLADKKGWSRKQYMEWQLTYHARINKSRDELRKQKPSKP